MWASWNSLERLSSLNNWVLGFAALFGFLAAVGVIAGWFLGARVSELQKAELSQFQTDAQTKIALANQTAAQANERAEQLAQENLKIRQQMADRVLAGDVRKTFINSVRHPGHVGTVIFIQDREAADYASDIFSALKEAGWNVGKQYRQAYDPDPRPRGILVRTAQSPDPTVKLLIAALEKIGANPRTEVAHTQDKGFIEIVVGAKIKE
jgi:multidrug efflux pump subunit AcrA (membrane-fusion protein)